MISPAAASDSVPAQPTGFRRLLVTGLAILAALSLLLLFHNHALNLIPTRTIILSPDQMKPDPAGKGFAYYVELAVPEFDRLQNPRSRVELREDGQPYTERSVNPAAIASVGGWRFSHQADRIVFSAGDASDPRTNGRLYSISCPRFYSASITCLALLGLGLSAAGLIWLAPHRRGIPAAPEARPNDPAPLWPLWLAGLAFAAGLYCNTGTLAPYGNTHFPWIDPATGYLYNTDHEHFKKLFAFVDGAPRAEWDGSLMLRRVLFTAFAWPFMKTAGFETGGTLASLALHGAVFIFTVAWMRRRLGARAAVWGAWLVALYPGAAYWAALPYPYAAIAPGSLLFLIALHELEQATTWRRLVALSAGMGLGYLAYDFAPFFIPASGLLLLWRRRFAPAFGAAIVQIVPLLLWLLVLKHGFAQQLENSNTAIYGAMLRAYLDPGAWSGWWETNRHIVELTGDVFFGANFLFLPLLFVAALLLNPWTSRISLSRPEVVLLLAVAALFLFNNLAPAYGNVWPLRGSWVARLYQPAFAAMIFFISRWGQHLPRLDLFRLVPIAAIVLFTAIGNLLVLFGPILGNPGRVSEAAFYQFYAHVDGGALRPYGNILKTYGRRPLGFPRPQP